MNKELTMKEKREVLAGMGGAIVLFFIVAVIYEGYCWAKHKIKTVRD